MKIEIALTYIAIYDKILNNYPVDLCYFINQVFNSDIVIKSIKDPYLIINLVKCVYNKIAKCIVKNELNILDEIMKTFVNDMHNLLREKIILII